MYIYIYIYIYIYKNGDTPLQVAESRGHGAVATLLRSAHAPVGAAAGAAAAAAAAAYAMYAQPQQVQVQVPVAPAAGLTCKNGGDHDFSQVIKVKNDATNRNGGLGFSTPVGIGADFKGQSEHDHGERVVAICRWCGKTVGELGGPMQSSRLENDDAKGGCCVVT